MHTISHSELAEDVQAVLGEQQVLDNVVARTAATHRTRRFEREPYPADALAGLASPPEGTAWLDTGFSDPWSG